MNVQTMSCIRNHMIIFWFGRMREAIRHITGKSFCIQMMLL